MQGELGKINPNNPNYVLELAVGPPAPNLVPQQPGSGAQLSGQFLQAPARYVFKKAHVSNDDFRIFDSAGHLVANSHHLGKNPYGELDVLGSMPQSQLGEWNSMMNVTGYHGMPSFKVRPKQVSRHGTQYVQDYQGRCTRFSISKQSRLKTMSVRHNLEVVEGEGGKALYTVLCDMVGRTMNIVNDREETCIFIQKSPKTLIMNAALGHGSELMIDVATGVDWTAAVAIVLGIQQVGESMIKDAASSFVVNPLTNAAQDQVLDMTGTTDIYNSLASKQNSVLRMANMANRIRNEFFR